MATQFVNKHITRVLAAGGTVADAAWASTAEAWLTSQGLMPYLFDWANPAFGVVKNGSNQISKNMGLGTTWLPRVGDLTPVSPTNTTYSATAINSFPGWVNGTSSAVSYYGVARDGSTRVNPFRRKHWQGLTVVSVYKKSGTNAGSLFGYGNFGGIYLQNTSGASGQCKINIGNPGSGTNVSATHATTLTNGNTNIIGGTFNQPSGLITPYVEGVAGSTATLTASSSTTYRPMLGQPEGNETYAVAVSGSSTSQTSLSGASPIYGPPGNFSNEASFSASDLIIFLTDLTSTQMASLNSLLRTRYGP